MPNSRKHGPLACVAELEANPSRSGWSFRLRPWGSAVASGHLRFAAAAWLAGLVYSADSAGALDPLNIPDTKLEPVAWADLDGWSNDDHGAAFIARGSSGSYVTDGITWHSARAGAVNAFSTSSRKDRNRLKTWLRAPFAGVPPTHLSLISLFRSGS